MQTHGDIHVQFAHISTSRQWTNIDKSLDELVTRMFVKTHCPHGLARVMIVISYNKNYDAHDNDDIDNNDDHDDNNDKQNSCSNKHK